MSRLLPERVTSEQREEAIDDTTESTGRSECERDSWRNVVLDRSSAAATSWMVPDVLHTSRWVRDLQFNKEITTVAPRSDTFLPSEVSVLVSLERMADTGKDVKESAVSFCIRGTLTA